MADDPYRYFRVEARELLESLGQGVLALERAAADRDHVARLLRLAHTLKGAARVVRQPGIAEQAHAVEEILAPFRDGGATVARERIDAVLGLLDLASDGVRALDPAAERPRAGAPAPEEPMDTVRVELGEMDALLEGVAEAGVQLSALRHALGPLERARQLAGELSERLGPRRRGPDGAHPLAEELSALLQRLERSLGGGVDRVEGEVAQVRDAAHRLRLLPASVIFPVLERAARDAAGGLSKRVEFRAAGGDVRLDAHVLTAMRDALLHAVRNAVAHGVEPEAARAAASKPPAGRVEVSVERRGARVVFACRDDGRGIDVEALRQAAVRGGRVGAAAARSLGFDEVVRLVLGGGVSTTRAADHVSGRGVGLDVVRATAEGLKGRVSVRSEPGVGTTLEVSVPVSLSSLSVLTVEAGGATLSIPLDAVRKTLPVTEAGVVRGRDGDAVVCEGRTIPYASLAGVLALGAPARARGTWPAVVVQDGGSLAALGVGRLLGVAEVIVRPLPALAVADPAVAGASLDAEGHPRLVLDPAGLVAATGARRGAADDVAPTRPPVLVVDDSLTTRMLEQSILEAAGYEVDLASSGEEAVERARARRYGLFVVDVEMPGMSGFEFVALTRADAALREVPAILVTSRDAPEDRRRGEQAGASAYVVKGEFDQKVLLGIIRGLTGGER